MSMVTAAFGGARNYAGLTEEETELGLEVAEVALGKIDYIADTIILDARGAEMFGLPAERPISRQTLHDRIHPEDQPSVYAKVERLFDPADDHIVDVQHRTYDAEGHLRWVQARKRVFWEGEGEERRPVRGIVALLDITSWKTAETRADFLMGELRHRTQNLLTVVGGIARMLSRTAEPDETPASFLKRFQQRLAALAINQQIGRPDGTGGSLHTRVCDHVKPFIDPDEERLSVEGPQLSVKAEALQAVGMCVHELSTNAVKHGAWSVERGRVEIRWGTEGEDFVFTWREIGGPEVTPPDTPGYGTQVLTRFTEMSVGGAAALDYDPAGLSYRLVAPIRNVRQPD